MNRAMPAFGLRFHEREMTRVEVPNFYGVVAGEWISGCESGDAVVKLRCRAVVNTRWWHGFTEPFGIVWESGLLLVRDGRGPGNSHTWRWLLSQGILIYKFLEQEGAAE